MAQLGVHPNQLIQVFVSQTLVLILASVRMRLKVESTAKLIEALEEMPDRVQALFAEATQTAVFDDNTKRNRGFSRNIIRNW